MQIRNNITTFLLVSAVFLAGCSGNYTEDLKHAEELYQSGDKETAKEFYSKAVKKGSPEAHFALAYQYHVTREEGIYHFSEAAKKGHGKALGYALEYLLFRADSLEYADPKGALDLYYRAKKANPDLDLYDEDNKLRIMKMCAEAGDFNAEAFCKKYDLKPHSDETLYHVWQIAEEASRGGRFGKPDPELVFQLVIRGGWVPAEVESAVEETYKNWKNGEVKEFNICDHITSGAGMGFCASRANDEDKNEREAKLVAIEEKLNEPDKQLLRQAYDSAVKFIEAKAGSEECHGGSGITAWIIGSEIDQKNAYLKMVADVQEGFEPKPKDDFPKSDKILNDTYQTVIQKMKAMDPLSPYLPTIDQVREIERLWITYRDASVKLFMAINPSVDEAVWKSWLTELRTAQLKELLESIEFYAKV